MIRGVGAVILYTSDLARAVDFYRALGLPLEREQHDEGPLHYACALGATHFALFASEPGPAPGFRTAGSTFFGFSVVSVSAALSAARRAGAPVVQEAEEFPWGRRALVRDPDGRVLELFEPPSA